MVEDLNILTLEEAEDGSFEETVKSCMMVVRVTGPLARYTGESQKNGKPYTKHSLSVEDDSEAGQVDIVDFADRHSGRSRSGRIRAPGTIREMTRAH